MTRTICALLLLTLLGGCSLNEGISKTYQWMLNPRFGSTDSEIIAKAFDTEDPDKRREGILAMSKREGGMEGKYLKAYALLAEDPDPLVRGTAINTLGRAGDPAYLDVIIKALDDVDLRVRIDAAEALDKVHGESAIAPLSKFALNDLEMDIRARCMKALRYYKNRTVLEVLLQGLDDREYGVRYAALGSLREMTGSEGGYDVAAWRKMLAAKDDPFAPEVEPDKSWWQRLWD